MKVVFLDFDGVLNNYKERNFGETFSVASCRNFNAFVKRVPDIKIVISSSWRMHGVEYCKSILEKNGINSDNVIDRTGNEDGIRGNQIQAWLDRNPQVTEFVIIDDESDMGELRHKLAKTNGFVGLTESEVDEAIEILGKK